MKFQRHTTPGSLLSITLFALVWVLQLAGPYPVHAQVHPSSHDPTVVRQQVEFLHSSASNLHDAITHLGQVVDLDDDFKAVVSDATGFLDAFGKDLSTTSQRPFRLEQSHTLEHIAKFTLGKMPDIVNHLQKAGI